MNWAVLAVALLAVFLGSACGFTAGVGMGTVYYPIFIALLDFDIGRAAFFSNALYAAGGFTVTLYYWNKRHPEIPGRRLIDLELAATYTPLLLLGFSLGVFVNLLVQSSTKLCIMAMLLTVMTIFTYQRAWTLLQEDRQKNEGTVQVATEKPPELASAGNIHGFPVWVIFLELALIWTLHIMLVLAVDNSTMYSASWWLFQAIKIPVALLACTLMVVQFDHFALADHTSMGGKGKDAPPASNTGRWEELATGAKICLAGIAIQLTGLSSGMILSPLLLYLGHHPLVGSSTSGFMVMLAASATSLELRLYGDFDYTGLPLFMLATVSGAYTGLRTLELIIKKYRTTAGVVLLLGVILTIAGIFVYAEIISDLAFVGPYFLVGAPRHGAQLQRGIPRSEPMPAFRTMPGAALNPVI
eukprot:CAMPEP_0117653952 /NCGR_PEP_ID=MMETSP0804-20121206/3477_1 /TAXON_ID=1074897 /ORGANISM="Tetraselmis astigmatica, Strain CCMP880" /LENGTH=413 /DNA_ID=CAMNT_0005460185 /DNA_START=324 /DNA_END=1565 /DNA_ORIENTATION=+